MIPLRQNNTSKKSQAPTVTPGRIEKKPSVKKISNQVPIKKNRDVKHIQTAGTGNDPIIFSKT
jgi:hypothetical protein